MKDKLERIEYVDDKPIEYTSQEFQRMNEIQDDLILKLFDSKDKTNEIRTALQYALLLGRSQEK